MLIQASVTMENDDTKKREMDSLLKAMDEQNMDIGYIYTYNSSEKIVINSKTIIITPFWEILLTK